MEPDDYCKCGHLYHSECLRNGGCAPTLRSASDELSTAWSRFVDDLKVALLDVVVRTAYRIAWVVDRVRHG